MNSLTMTGANTTTNNRNSGNGNSTSDDGDALPKNFHRVWWLVGFFSLDLALSAVLLLPFIPGIQEVIGTVSGRYTLWGYLMDLAVLAGLRISSGIVSLIVSYETAKVRPEFTFDLNHPNGDKKTREELEMEALEESLWPWLKRFVSRPAFICEVVCLLTQLLAIAKCLARLDVEVGRYQDSKPSHPLFWVAAALASLCSVVELSFIDSMGQKAAQYGDTILQASQTTFFRRVGSQLSIPLLAEDHQEGEIGPTTTPTTDDGDDDPEQAVDEGRAVGTSDITGDAGYKAGWSDLLYICYPDLYYIVCAFVFLLLAAVAQVYIPKFTGNILDSLSTAFSKDDDDSGGKSMIDVPGFIANVKYLVLASIFCGIFSAIRGSIFTVVGGRVNVRLRVQLMDSLLSQDVGFFDTTKTGDITSRLSSDTTLVGDQVTLNVNVFLRSLVQAIGVLIFMFTISWQLSIIAFISVPVVTALSKWYGNFLRSLTKLMQKKLADGNSISEAAIGSMPTVKAFDAAEGELREFEGCMREYLHLNLRAATAYLGYCTVVTALPYLVIAVVVFYGGLLVRNEDMTSGELVSFILYLQSLSDAFSSIGYIFSSLTQAVGAADKVFELMHRKPRYRVPSTTVDSTAITEHRGIFGITAMKTSAYRQQGLRPETCRGQITLENVELFYPARPQRRVLNGLSMEVPPGSIVALVGSSGGGKSSVMSLVQHLYEPSSGRVLLDGIEVPELSPTWLSQHVSIVSQEPTLFGRSVKRNIMYGLEGTDREPSDEEIREAASLANASEFIENMPQKYDTEVGERGVQLSGGQKQRIAIARALVRKPSVLLLDEATSALDSESEHMVQQAIDQMIARGRGGNDGHSGMTVMIVAHRLSTVRNADVIFVVRDGQVVERGKHDELLENSDGFYASLISRQMNTQKKMEG